MSRFCPSGGEYELKCGCPQGQGNISASQSLHFGEIQLTFISFFKSSKPQVEMVLCLKKQSTQVLLIHVPPSLVFLWFLQSTLFRFVKWQLKGAAVSSTCVFLAFKVLLCGRATFATC